MRYLLLCSLLFSFSAIAKPDYPRLIEVGAVGEKSVDPDMANINLEIWSKAHSAKEAQSLNAKEYDRVVKLLSDTYKIEKKDMQTNYYSVSPQSEYDDKTRTSHNTGYRVSHSLMITLRNVKEVGNFMDAMANGDESAKTFGTSLGGLSWDTSKREQLEQDAIAVAIQHARARAEAIAKAGKVGLGELMHVSHNVSSPGNIMPKMRGAMMEMAGASVLPGTAVQSGEVKVSASVTCEYLIN